jgi:tRNA threonylcarbamoyladenosine biosynthesis protein TsaE
VTAEAFDGVFDVVLDVPGPEDMHRLGRALAGLLRAGDLLVLTGDLGAGKTTLTQGVGAGLGVRGEVTSPTFVIARVHPSTVSGPPLVHVDAYRLAGLAEVDDLDLDADLDAAVTVVEWGEGKVEELSEDRLEVVVRRPRGGGLPDLSSAAGSQGDDPARVEDTDPRRVELRGVGPRWATVDLAALAAASGGAGARASGAVGPTA